MATAHGAWTGPGNGYRSVLVYTLADNGTSVTISTTVKIQFASYAIVGGTVNATSVIGTGSGSSTSRTVTNVNYGPNQTYTLITKSRTYNKTGADQTIALSGNVAEGSATGSTASVNVTVAKLTYPVTYDVNGGDASTTPAAQEKVYGTTLTLTTTVPKRAGCTFLGWATGDEGTGTAYASGGSYTANAPLNLYAIWLGASIPTIEAERTDSQGQEADEGTYGTVAASWQAIGSPAATVTVTATNVTTGASITLTGDTSGSKAAQQGASGNVSALFGADDGQPGALDIDTRYTIRVTVTVEAQDAYSGRTVTASSVAYVTYAYITIDAYAGGHGVAFGKTANREGFDVAMSPLYFSEPPTHDTDLTTYSAASIITANTGSATITSAAARRWGKVVQLSINWTNDSAITVPATGNISNVTVGTIAEGLRPAILSAAHSYGDSAGAAWYYVATNGTVQLGAMEGTGAERTIAAGTTFNMLCTFVLP